MDTAATGIKNPAYRPKGLRSWTGGNERCASVLARPQYGDTAPTRTRTGHAPDDRVLVTSNVDDFAKLASAREIHAGIVLIERAGLLRDEQIELIPEIAAAVAGHGAMVNEVLRVGEDGSMTFETWPQQSAPQ